MALGTMMLGAYGNADDDDAIRIIRAALDGGMRFVDTADVYSAGESEEIVGHALMGRRDDIVLATKFALPMGAGPNHSGGSRRYIVRAVEDSLRRLRTDYIDLFLLPYSLVDRTIETEHVAAGQELGLGITAWSPLAGGFLTGKYRDTGNSVAGEGRLSRAGLPQKGWCDRDWELVTPGVKLGDKPAGYHPATRNWA